MGATLEEKSRSNNKNHRGEIMKQGDKKGHVKKNRIEERFEEVEKKVITEREMFDKERELLKDLEKLMALSQSDAKELIEELESSGYGNYLERIMKLPEFSDEYDFEDIDSQTVASATPATADLILEPGSPETGIPLFKIESSENDASIEPDLTLNVNDEDITWRSLHQKGLEYIKAGMHEKSLYYFDKGLVMMPDNQELLASKGMALYWMNKPKEALKWINKALKKDPEYSKAWNVKGLILKSSGQLNQASKCFSTSIKLNPDYVTGWFEKAQISQELGNYELAIKYYDKALEIDPKNAGAHYLKDLCEETLMLSKQMMLT
jgi:tetratricopeptide (TPR) repeat protein